MENEIQVFEMPAKRILSRTDRKPILVPIEVHKKFSDFHAKHGRAQAWVSAELVVLAGIEAIEARLTSVA